MGCTSSRVNLLISGPMMPPTRPPAITSEMAFALHCTGVASAAAKR